MSMDDLREIVAKALADHQHGWDYRRPRTAFGATGDYRMGQADAVLAALRDAGHMPAALTEDEQDDLRLSLSAASAWADECDGWDGEQAKEIRWAVSRLRCLVDRTSKETR